MLYVKSKLLLLLFVLALVAGCTKDDPKGGPAIDWEEARFTDFQLAEVTYSERGAWHPVVDRGVETERGEIHVIIPRGTTGLQLTPLPSNFTNPDFTVTPALGQVTDFLNKTVTYTIAAKADPAKKVHYDVTITEEAGTGPAEAEVTAFRFEKSKNGTLPTDISASRIIHGDGTMGKIYVFVPAGTNFASLTPTIEYRGTGLFYSQDAAGIPGNSTTVYPAAGLSIDLAYPKVFYAVVKNGSRVRTYDVVVDVKNPIKFDNPTITTTNVRAGSTQSLAAVTTFINQGNHPVLLAAVTHTNQQPQGSNAIIASGTIPSFGLLPNERANVNATIRAQTYPAGTYQSMAVFLPKLYHEPDADGLMEATGLVINAAIEE